MHSKWVFSHFSSLPRRHFRHLAVLWIVGLLAGIVLCDASADLLTGYLHRLMHTSPSPLSLFAVGVIPVTIITVSLVTPYYFLAYPAVFLYAVSHGFSGALVCADGTTGSWLLRALLLFSGSCISVLLWWLLLVGQSKRHLRKNIGFVCSLTCFVYLFDLFVMLPLVGDLAKYF